MLSKSKNWCSITRIVITNIKKKQKSYQSLFKSFVNYDPCVLRSVNNLNIFPKTNILLLGLRVVKRWKYILESNDITASGKSSSIFSFFLHFFPPKHNFHIYLMTSSCWVSCKNRIQGFWRSWKIQVLWHHVYSKYQWAFYWVLRRITLIELLFIKSPPCTLSTDPVFCVIMIIWLRVWNSATSMFL